jgi:hypothetical protein
MALSSRDAVTLAPPDGLEPQYQRSVLDWYLEVGRGTGLDRDRDANETV